MENVKKFMVMIMKKNNFDRYKNYPRQEDVTQINTDNQQISIVRITDDNHDYLIEVALSMYLNEQCKYCGKTYITLDDLHDTVFAGFHEHGRLACRSCWDKVEEQK